MRDTQPPDPALLTSAPPEPTGLPGRALAVFYTPRRLFEGLGVDAPWLGALGISVVVGILVVVVAPDHLLYEGMQGATTRRGVPVEITSPPEVVAIFERVRLSMGVVGSQPLLAAMAAGALLLVFGRIARGPATFRQYLAVTTHAFLISAAGAMVALAIRLATGNWAWQPTLASLAEGAGASLPAWAGAVNPFTLWMWGVIGIGVAAANRWNRAAAPVAFLLAAYLGAVILIRSVF